MDPISDKLDDLAPSEVGNERRWQKEKEKLGADAIKKLRKHLDWAMNNYVEAFYSGDTSKQRANELVNYFSERVKFWQEMHK